MLSEAPSEPGTAQRVVLVVAVADNGVIGADGDLPWRLPPDLAHFKRTTLGHVVVMGRKTYDSLGRPLPGRTNVVVTRQPDWSADGVLTAGSLDSMGSTTVMKDGHIDMGASYDVLKRMIQVFSSPQAAKLMAEGQHEVGGIIPIGAAYPIVHDRNYASVQAMAGKRIGTFDNDRAQAMLIQKLGAQPVAVDVSNVGTKFNNNMVDVTYLPALTYRPFELAKGMGAKGAFVRLPVMLPTFQVVLDKAAFPEGFGQLSRTFWLSQYDRAMQLINRSESGVPNNHWFDIPADAVAPYVEVLRQGRLEGAQAGLYSKRTLNLLKKARCQLSPANAECATQQEIE